MVDAVSRGDHARSTGLSLILASCLQESPHATAVSGRLIAVRSRTSLELLRQNITDSRRLGRVGRGGRLGVGRRSGVQRIGELAVAVGASQAGAGRSGSSVGNGIYRRRIA